MPEMLWKMRNLPIHAKTTQAQSPVILMTLQMTLKNLYEKKTVSNLIYRLDLYVNIPQSGIDLNTYPKNWIENWMIAYGVFRKVSSIDPQKTYDYHMAFDIKPTEVVYNVDLDMNRKKILNIPPDGTKNNSAVTVKMVKDLKTKLSPHTKKMHMGKYLRNLYKIL